MPFTLAHPAIVLPITYLSKRWYSLTGLVIGSITPDFEYFIRMKVRSSHSHTLKGLFYFDLPLGLLLCFVFHCIVRNPLYQNLPTVLRRHVMLFESFDWVENFRKRWPIIFVSLIAGAASHLVWDGFTHPGGYFVEIFPILKERISGATANVPVYKLLQHSSTVAGICAVVFSVAKLPIKNENRCTHFPYWICFCVITMVTTGVRLLIGRSGLAYSHVFVTIISGFMLALIFTPVIFKNYRKAIFKRQMA